MKQTQFLILASTLMISGCATNLPSNTPDNDLTTVNSTTKTTQITTSKNTEDEHTLNGIQIKWTYTSGSGMVLSFEHGLAQYEWISGPRKGRMAKNIPYRSRKIGDEMFLINWVQPEKPDFITLIFDFNKNVVFSSGLIGYGTNRQRNLFLKGVVDDVER